MTKKLVVLGLGKSGLAATKLAINKGYEVIACDKNLKILTSIEKISSCKKITLLGDDEPKKIDWEDIELLVVSPGIKVSHPIIKEAKRRGTKILVEQEFALKFLHPNTKLIGITGTNGKTTTLLLLSAVLKEAGISHHIGGNIGIPLSSLVDKVNKEDILILEWSSFQLFYASSDIKHDIVVLLNISTDHLDWHDSEEDYIDAKKKLIMSLVKEDGYRIINLSLKSYFPKKFCSNNKVIFFSKAKQDFFLPESIRFYLKPHNLENISAIANILKVLNVSQNYLNEALVKFNLPPHRIEYVGEKDKVIFIDDSKATNIGATLAACDAFSSYPVILILGGTYKGGDFSCLKKRKNIKRVIILGEEAKDYIKDGIEGTIPYIEVKTMKDAVFTAYSIAKYIQGKEKIVLLSPGCASFELFSSFEERGKAFKEEVNRICTQN